jgi:hypothetical protein
MINFTLSQITESSATNCNFQRRGEEKEDKEKKERRKRREREEKEQKIQIC